MVKRKRKKRKSFLRFILLFILVIFIFIILFNNRFFKKIDFSINGVIDYYDIYGIHLNFEGSFKLNDKYKNPKLVLTDGSNETIINWDLSNNENKYSFKTSDYINDGINLEKLKNGTYYLLIKVNDSDSDKYFPLVNDTKYNDLVYYTLTSGGKNKKIDIAFKKHYGHELLTFDIKNTNLPDDVYDITIDPGHDGNDSGVIVCENGDAPNNLGECDGKSYKEADLNFTVSFELKKALENLGYKVKLTRDSKDDTVNTYGKMGSATTANSVKSKFNLAIHHNSTNIPGGMSSVYGFEIYMAGDSKFDLANLFVKNIKKYANASTSTKKEFKVQDGIYQRFSDDGKTPYYYMIREVGGIATGAYVDGSNEKYDENPYYDSNNTAEGYLFELGYIDNVKELKNILNNPEGYAKGIALAIDEYLK